MRVAIDTGGTFTDCVYLQDGKFVVLKVFSTPHDPGEAVLDGLRQIATGPGVVVRHGTTVGTNTMLERKGARVAFVTTKGFEDTIAIGRQARPKLYDWFQPAPECLVREGLRFGIRERTSAECEIIQGVDSNELNDLVSAIQNANVDAVALSLLFSFANSKNESEVAAALERLGLPLSISHKILPEFREYERASTVVANAYLAPKMGAYLTNLATSVESGYEQSRLEVMQSSGGIISAKLAAAEPVRTVLSGPAGGVIGAHRLASVAGFSRIIGFDMGGTSTDVCLVDAEAGRLHISNESVVSGVPIGVPMLDIHTAGAGGGSIARFDAGGMLRVGPESAGSEPGPICFGRGTMPTVTDANLLLGRLDSGTFLDGDVPLDSERTAQIMLRQKGSLRTVEEFAAGILRVVETQMEKAIRVISVERGNDPRNFALVAFGGGGPLHACSLARALRIPTVLVPAMPGALSAVGILLADTVRDYSRTVMLPGDAIESVEDAFTELEQRGIAEFTAEGLQGVSQLTVDMRYRGQGYELNVPYTKQSPAHALEEFHSLHQQRYGFCDVQRPVEIVNLRLRMITPGEPYVPAYREPIPGDGSSACYAEREVFFDEKFIRSRLYRREGLAPGDKIQGPAIITEDP